MVFAFATFGLVLGIILGVYWLLVFGRGAQESAVLARIGGPPNREAAALLKGPQRLSEMRLARLRAGARRRLVEPLRAPSINRG